MSLDLDRLLGDSPFGFRLGLAQGAGGFFQNNLAEPGILRERRRILDRWPALHALALPGAGPPLEELRQYVISLHPGADIPHPNDQASPVALAGQLGRCWQPDFLLLSPELAGPVMQAGCVCFPSFWSPDEKIGQPLQAIHQPVPGLNDKLGRQIGGFLQHMRPGADWERWNWGLAATPDLNAHPLQALPRLGDSAGLDDTWLRVEHQALRVLPRTGSILFGIRVACHRLDQVLTTPALRSRMARLLRTMPDEVASYKGLARCRTALIDGLGRA